MKILNIAKPWYSAYQKYGWWEHVPGIGLNKHLVDSLAEQGKHLTLTIGTDPQKYRISGVRVKGIAYKYNSTYIARDNTILYVIPQNELKKVPMKTKATIFSNLAADMSERVWCKNHPRSIWGRMDNGEFFPQCSYGFKYNKVCDKQLVKMPN